MNYCVYISVHVFVCNFNLLRPGIHICGHHILGRLDHNTKFFSTRAWCPHMRALYCHFMVAEEYNTLQVSFKMANNTPGSSDGNSRSKLRSAKRSKLRSVKKVNQISWLILVQICIKVLNVCYGSQILQKLVTVTINHDAKHDVHVCVQRDLVLLVLS